MTGTENMVQANDLAPMLATMFFAVAYLLWMRQPQCVQCRGVNRHEDDCPFNKDRE